jgi:pimeloyl-[acyl-carrier protein] methyl ester esterase
VNTTHCIFIPGWGGADASWDAVRQALPGSWTHECLSWVDPDGVKKRLDALERPACVVGWSLGALLALDAATHAPKNLNRISLVGGTAHLCAEEAYPGAAPRLLKAMRLRLRRSPEQVLRDFAELCAQPDSDSDFIDGYLQQARNFSSESLDAGLRCLQELDVRPRLSKVQCPVLALHGDKDGVIPLDNIQYAVERLPHADLRVLSDEGHALPHTAPQTIATALENFST